MTPDRIESLCVIPGPAGDVLYLMVSRGVDGQRVRSIERMSDFPSDDTPVADAWFVDCGNGYVDPDATVHGLDHLNGRTVSILADGVALPDQTVINGAVELYDADGSCLWASKVIIGLPYTSVVQPMPLEPQTPLGTAIGKIKRIDTVTVLFDRSGSGATIGRPDGKQDALPIADGALFTGARTVPFRGQADTKGELVITQDRPLPLTVLAVVPHNTVYDRD